MMKKFLVLALVMGIASLANAGLSLAKDGQTVTLVGADYTIVTAITNFMVFTLDTAVPTLNYTGAGSSITDMIPVYGAAAFEGMLGLSAGAVKAAYSVDLKDTDVVKLTNGTLVTAQTVGQGTVYLLDQGGATLGSIVVPEPATMALLGLGALVLRRKK